MNERLYQGTVAKLRSPERLARLEIPRVVELSLEGIPATTVLDIGTGSGVFAEAFAHKGLTVSGIDVSDEMLEAARQFVPGGNFQKSSMESLPYPDGSFDLAFLGLVLHEASDLTAALKEAFRTTVKRVLILEWPYQSGEFGPPLDHRLTPLQVEKTALEVGFSYMEHISLEHLALYRLTR